MPGRHPRSAVRLLRARQRGRAAAIASITTGLGWKQVAEPLTVLGGPDPESLEACWELGATVAAGLLP
ncbi:hypothetical protein GCM10023222_12120 [Saccharopolyspora cebuensis]|uniref:Uncharacterized protein n=1 Tax=Saccharopolyspora cebuensis TaxID=418759 RepID=A0ABV4CII2_9PSEU